MRGWSLPHHTFICLQQSLISGTSCMDQLSRLVAALRLMVTIWFPTPASCMQLQHHEITLEIMRGHHLEGVILSTKGMLSVME